MKKQRAKDERKTWMQRGGTFGRLLGSEWQTEEKKRQREKDLAYFRSKIKNVTGSHRG